jgi:hypothetical protein
MGGNPVSVVPSSRKYVAQFGENAWTGGRARADHGDDQRHSLSRILSRKYLLVNKLTFFYNKYGGAGVSSPKFLLTGLSTYERSIDLLSSRPFPPIQPNRPKRSLQGVTFPAILILSAGFLFRQAICHFSFASFSGCRIVRTRSSNERDVQR